MKYVYLTLSIAGFLAAGSLYAAVNESDDQREITALNEWIATKRSVTVRERGGSLSISGDVRAEYISHNEKKSGFKNIGSRSFHPNIADDQFDIEFNLLLDYRTEFNWASLKLEFDNNMGIYSGTQNKLSLERAFLGMRMWETDNYTLDVEIGRRKLNYYFDSKIQFSSYMDGVLFKYNQSAEKVGDLYIYGGPFVVDEKRDQFAYVIEFGLLNIMQTGFYGKYSIINWDTKNFKDPKLRKRFQFLNNEFIAGYSFVPPKINKVTTCYASFLINAVAGKHDILNYERNNIGYYFGVQMGEVRKRGDWSFDLNYQLVQPQAIPDFDLSGIGKVGADNIGLYTIKMDGGGAATTRSIAMGRANYQGWQIQFLYLLSDTVSMSQSYAQSKSLHYLPTRYTYKKYKLEFIYAF